MSHMGAPMTPEEQDYAADCVAPGARPSLELIPEIIDEDYEEE